MWLRQVQGLHGQACVGPCGRAWGPPGNKLADRAQAGRAPERAGVEAARACMEAAGQTSSRQGAGKVGTTVGVRGGPAAMPGGRRAKKQQARLRQAGHTSGCACKTRGVCVDHAGQCSRRHGAGGVCTTVGVGEGKRAAPGQRTP